MYRGSSLEFCKTRHRIALCLRGVLSITGPQANPGLEIGAGTASVSCRAVSLNGEVRSLA